MQRVRSAKPDRDTLNRLYRKDRVPPTEIGKQFDASANTVYRWLKEYGIETFSRGTARPFQLKSLITPHPSLEGASLVMMTNGGHAIIDTCDAEVVSQFNWHKRMGGNTLYAFANRMIEGRPSAIPMHRLLLELNDPRVFVDHKNRDGMDNRRSVNLRIATIRQNNANRRDNARTKSGGEPSSIYRGVCRSSSGSRWVASIGNAPEVFNLGTYDVEVEAGYAFAFAASILRDSEFSTLTTVPDKSTIGASRVDEIESDVLLRIQARRNRKKPRSIATSRYVGVTRTGKAQLWRTCFKVGGERKSFGLYGTELQAAFAYDVAVRTWGLESKGLNGINADDVSHSDEISAIVKAKVSAYSDGFARD